ncbi:MAG: tetratricopeptide repeat protein [Bacteroidetes bacterium]|nr:tetratricopeptide repeat protein [Bacteroidota bacterium]
MKSWLLSIFIVFIVCTVSRAGNAEQIIILEQKLTGMPDDTLRVNLLLKIGKYYCSRENDKALLYLQQSLTLATELGYAGGIAKSFLWQGRVYYYKDEYQLSETYLSKAKDLLIKEGDSANLAFYYFATGSLHDLNGNYIVAIDEYQDAVRLAGNSGDESLKSAALASLGAIYNRLEEPGNALLYLHEALQIREKTGDPLGVATILTCIGASYEEKQMLDSALHYYLKGYEIRIASEDIRPVASSVYSLGTIYNKMNRFEDAILAFEKAIVYYNELDEQTGWCNATLQLARSLNSTGQNAQATEKAMEALAVAEKLKNNSLISEAYETLSSLAASAGEFEEAYRYNVLHKKVSDILYSQKKENAIKEIEARFRLQSMRGEMENLRLTSTAQRRNILLLTISIVTLITLLILIFLLYRLKSQAHNRQKRLFEQDIIIRQQSEALKEKEKIILQEQLETQNRELAAKALEILRINETLGHIITRLEELSRIQPGNPMVEKEINHIVREIELHTQHNSWQEFDTIFKNIHNKFYEKLLEKCPDLTASEIKIAALLKLNLSTKEIASITMKSEEGIKSTRYRLRKKLNISSDENLIPFLMQL